MNLFASFLRVYVVPAKAATSKSNSLNFLVAGTMNQSALPQ